MAIELESQMHFVAGRLQWSLPRPSSCVTAASEKVSQLCFSTKKRNLVRQNDCQVYENSNCRKGRRQRRSLFLAPDSKLVTPRWKTAHYCRWQENRAMHSAPLLVFFSIYPLRKFRIVKFPLCVWLCVASRDQIVAEEEPNVLPCRRANSWQFWRIVHAQSLRLLQAVVLRVRATKAPSFSHRSRVCSSCTGQKVSSRYLCDCSLPLKVGCPSVADHT